MRAMKRSPRRWPCRPRSRRPCRRAHSYEDGGKSWSPRREVAVSSPHHEPAVADRKALRDLRGMRRVREQGSHRLYIDPVSGHLHPGGEERVAGIDELRPGRERSAEEYDVARATLRVQVPVYRE